MLPWCQRPKPETSSYSGGIPQNSCPAIRLHIRLPLFCLLLGILRLDCRALLDSGLMWLKHRTWTQQQNSKASSSFWNIAIDTIGSMLWMFQETKVCESGFSASSDQTKFCFVLIQQHRCMEIFECYNNLVIIKHNHILPLSWSLSNLSVSTGQMRCSV